MLHQSVKLVFPTDFSENAAAVLPIVRQLSLAFKAEVYLLHVIEPPTGIARMMSDFDENRAIAEARKQLLTFATGLGLDQDKEIDATLIAKIGKPYLKIAEAVDELGAEMVVMGTSGASGLQAVLAGSNASKVIRTSDVPVISIREARESIKTILVPVGVEPASSVKNNQAIHFAKNLGAKLEFVAFVSAEDKAEAELAVKRMTDYAQGAGAKDVAGSVVVINGSAGDAVMSYAEGAGVDLICVVADGDVPGSGYLRSIADYVVQRSAVPVLSISGHSKTSVSARTHV